MNKILTLSRKQKANLSLFLLKAGSLERQSKKFRFHYWAWQPFIEWFSSILATSVSVTRVKSWKNSPTAWKSGRTVRTIISSASSFSFSTASGGATAGAPDRQSGGGRQR